MERSRAFCFTLNNYTEAEVAEFKAWNCIYLIFGKEVGVEGTPHLQGYVSFANAKQMKALKKLSQRAHWEIARGTPKQASEYCEKDGDVFEKGERPKSQIEKGALGKAKWDFALLCGVEKRMDELDSQMLIQCGAKIQYAAQIVNNKKRKLPDLDVLDNEWRWSRKTGTGKTRGAKLENPGYFIKAAKSKWWDGYEGEDVVILDDLDPTSREQAQFIKNLADHGGVWAEKKGQAAIWIRPRRIIVTSNYPIEEVYPMGDWAPVERRFKVLEMNEKWVEPVSAVVQVLEPDPREGLRVI